MSLTTHLGEHCSSKIKWLMDAIYPEQKPHSQSKRKAGDIDFNNVFTWFNQHIPNDIVITFAM